MNAVVRRSLRVATWALALGLVVLPVVALVNGWIGTERWPLRTLRVTDGLERVDAARLRETLLPHASSGFFAVKLDRAQAAVAQLPWVEHAEVRKRWPDVLEVRIVEHRPFARWGGDRLLSEQGRLFPVDGIDVPPGLPLLHGPDARVPDVVALYNESREMFAPGGHAVSRLALDSRDSWSLVLDNGIEVVVGSQEARLRMKRFARVLPQLLSRSPLPLQRADLRYTNGFALEWAKPGLGIGDWGFERAGNEALAWSRLPAFPNPQSPIPNPGSQS
ncbi:MAG TPA: cell division protein FtsQ/DivIB [Luteimonas sp.]|nr:cell division protein FtsQ/DivIB [Luteimonas sp.]HRP71910.1 cell division protein FtsQ/DivIB [Luteimonas sp.]